MLLVRVALNISSVLALGDVFPSAALLIVSILLAILAGYSVLLYFSALLLELLEPLVVKLEQDVQLVADCSAHVHLYDLLLLVVVARLERDKPLGPLSLFFADPLLACLPDSSCRCCWAQHCHLYVLADLPLPFDGLASQQRAPGHSRHLQVLTEELILLGVLG